MAARDQMIGVDTYGIHREWYKTIRISEDNGLQSDEAIQAISCLDLALKRSLASKKRLCLASSSIPFPSIHQVLITRERV